MQGPVRRRVCVLGGSHGARIAAHVWRARRARRAGGRSRLDLPVQLLEGREAAAALPLLHRVVPLREFVAAVVVQSGVPGGAGAGNQKSRKIQLYSQALAWHRNG